MLQEALVILFLVFWSSYALIILLTTYLLYKIHKEGLKNFIYAFISILTSGVALLLEYFVFTPLNDYEVVIFLPSIAVAALFGIYFITRGVFIFGHRESPILSNNDLKTNVFYGLIISGLCTTVIEIIVSLAKKGSSLHDFVHTFGDVLYIFIFSYSFLYLIQLRKPYKGGLFYDVVTKYIISFLMIFVCAMVMTVVLAPIELQDVGKTHELDVWRLVILNVAAVPLIIAMLLAYRTISMFKQILAQYQ